MEFLWLHLVLVTFPLVIFRLYQRYSLGLSFYIGAKFCCDHCPGIIVSRVFSRRKRFRAFGLQPARVPRKRPFPESFIVFPGSSIYPFVKAKPVSTLVFKWKSCFHNSLDKALYLPHYRGKLTIWHKPLRRDMKCLQVTLRRTNVRENSLWASCISSHEKMAVRERMIYFL